MNIIKTLLILLIAFVFTACNSKTPFKTKEPISGASQVYMYVSNSTSGLDYSMEDSKYKAQINGKNVSGTIEAGEYKVFDMKPATVMFTSIRNNIEQKHIKLNMLAGQSYYLKIQSQEYGGLYTFEQVSASEGMKELQESKLAGSFLMDMTRYVPEFGGSSVDGDVDNKIPAMSEAEIDAIIEKKLAAMGAGTTAAVAAAPAPRAKSSGSKLDEIKEAYEMKKEGLLTNEEFKAMKAEILAK